MAVENIEMKYLEKYIQSFNTNMRDALAKL